MKIYTGRGDDGMTDLRDMSRVSKTSPRIEAYGTVDELNALVGTVRPTGHDDIDEKLAGVQNHLHVVQADFANPDPDEDDPAITEEHVDQVEAWIDAYDDELEPLFPTKTDGNRFAVQSPPEDEDEAEDAAKRLQAVVEAHADAPTTPGDFFDDVMDALDSPAFGPMEFDNYDRPEGLDDLATTFEDAETVLDAELDDVIEDDGVDRGFM